MNGLYLSIDKTIIENTLQVIFIITKTHNYRLAITKKKEYCENS
jgi:hypothetical protein